MSKEISCGNCGQKFYPHGGQMFCSKGCRLEYYKRMKPESQRFLNRLQKVKSYNNNCIQEKKYGGEVKFEFLQCTRCFSKFALEMNQMFPFMETTCPFCRTETVRSSIPLPYYKVEEEER